MPSPDSDPSTSGTKRRSTNEDEPEPKVPKTPNDGSPGNAIEYAVNVILIQSAFKGQTSTYRITIESLEGEISDPLVILNQAQTIVRKIIKKKFEKLGYLEVVLNLHGSFVDNQYNEFEINASIIINEVKYFDARIQTAKNVIASKFYTFDQENEGDKEFLHLDLHINRHIMTDDMFVFVPKHLSNYVVNVRSLKSSEQSFKWAVLAALHPEIYNPQDYTLEKYSDELILSDIDYPVQLHDIPKIEEINDISFNIFVTKYNFFPNKREEIEGPVYHTARRRNKHFNLLLLQDGPKEHYCYIKNLSGLVTLNKGGSLCDGCLNFFEDIALKKHQENECLKKKTVIVPDDEKNMKFEADDKMEKMPIVVYADFEAFLEPVEDSTAKKRTEEKETYTINISKHVPYSFAYYIKCSTNDNLSQLQQYHGQDCAEKFMEMLQADIGQKIKEINNVSIIPVFFHNFSKYDAHFICRVLDAVPGKVSGLGSKHNFMAIHKTIVVKDDKNNTFMVQLRFLDSLNFLKGSMESLANNLAPEKFIEARKYWVNDEKFELMIQKGSFPYEYIESIEALEQTSLPPKELFYSSVKDTHISEDDYQRALRVWDLFECETIRDYSRYYLESDVLILADLFENLRRLCLDAYNLDPANYYTINTLSWDAMLQQTEIELELVTDVEMLAFITKAKRSGIAHCTKRHAVANNKKLPDTYNKDAEDSFIMFYDANNLYGWAMSQPLPHGGFKWVKNCSVEWVNTHMSDDFPDDSDVGYFLEVDLEYPEELHDAHADLPFCPERKTIPDCDGEKLVTDLTSKNHYVLHHSNLIQCLSHGLVLKKVHRVLRFKQSPWLKTYIDYNTERRTAAATTIDKDFYKLMNNTIYGKSIQNDEKYFDLKVIDHWFKDGLKHGGHSITRRADYHSHAVMSDNLIAIQLNKTKRMFNLPIYLGVSVYELSKAYMYEFHYNFMKKRYGDQLKLLYTDTDSFIYQIFTEDYYSEMSDALDERFDTSDYPEESLFHSQQNKKKVGFFKDELKGDVIKEFVALRPKVYMVEAQNKSIFKAAGVPKIFQKFTKDDYKRCLYKQEKIYKVMSRIKPVGYDIYTQKYRKIALSPAYANRYILDNFIDTLPFGHYSLISTQKKEI